MLVMCGNSIGAFSGRLAIAEAQQAAQAFPAYDRLEPIVVGGRRDDLAAQALVVSFLVCCARYSWAAARR